MIKALSILKYSFRLMCACMAIGYLPNGGIPGSCSRDVLNNFPKCWTFTFISMSTWEFPLLHILSRLSIFYLLSVSQWVLVSHCHFNWHGHSSKFFENSIPASFCSECQLGSTTLLYIKWWHKYIFISEPLILCCRGPSAGWKSISRHKAECKEDRAY